MLSITDQTGNEVYLNKIAKRIISLVPSQTELLYTLGLDSEVIGITKFCVHPKEWFHNKKRVGGTKNIHIDEITLLQPDLIIANKEENVRSQIESLKKIAPVYVSDVDNLDSALQMMYDVGRMTGKETKAAELIAAIQYNFSKLIPAENVNTAYFIWNDPYMTVGGDTFISDMLNRCGFINIFRNQNRYPEITLDDIKEKDCQLILLSSEPYPFKQEHLKAMEKQLPNLTVLLADGEMFSWYGSRLLLATDYFKKLIEHIKH